MWVRSAFTIVEPLVQGEGHSLCRALQDGAQRRPVVIEVGTSASAFELTRNLASRSVLKPLAQTTYEGVSTLILEDFDGVSLERLLDRPMTLEQVLHIGSAIADAVAEIHAEGVIHKDIRPESILVEPMSGAIKLVGFAIATRAPREPPVAPPRLVEGSLPYMSPEQTSHTNRAMDQRTDLYSLGVTLYRMLTGRLPFEASDPIEWIYCHVAREPPPPTELSPRLPRVISDIVMKLLAKLSEERYQTAHGVAVDLTRCLEEWRRTAAISPFPLGERDVSERVQLPPRFYGREPELAKVLTAFQRVVDSGTTELVVVSGHPGVGKSSLVRELRRPIVRTRGSFITGKADQYSRGVPYSTITTGLRDLVMESLTENEASIANLRSGLDAALGPNASVLTDLIPELEMLIGKKPSAVVLPPAEAKYRFLQTCQRFVGVFSRREHPLTLFLDDLQWADAASLELLAHLLTDPMPKCLLALGAYRDTEVAPSDPLATMLDEVRRAGAHVSDIHLSPLSIDHVTDLVADTVRASFATAAPLARLVHRKTEGNPFFVIEFLGTLVEDRLLEFDRVSLTWRWDVSRIEARNYTDNVVGLMVQKIERLPPATQSCLRVAACIGTLADARTLALLSREEENDVHQVLEPALREGLVLRRDHAYLFLHDRIQQAAYSLIAEDERAEFQLEIGRALLASSEAQDARSFEIAHHFLLGIDAITTPAERARTSQLFFDAGKRAKASMAYASAVTFFSAGVALLEAGSWDDAYALTYALHFELAECQWLSGDFETSERSLTVLLARARTNVERIAVSGIRVRVHMIRSERERAISAGLAALRQIGIHWSPHPSNEEVAEAQDLVVQVLGERPIESLGELPEMTNAEMKAALELVSLMIDAAYFVTPNLYELLACFGVVASLRHGNTPSSFVAYSFYAYVCGCRGRYRDAYRFGQLSVDYLSKAESKPQSAKICLHVGLSLAWVNPYRSTIDVFERGARDGSEIGDLLFAAYCACEPGRVLFAAGEPLADLDRVLERSVDFVGRLNYEEVVYVQRVLARVVQKLRGMISAEEEEETSFDRSIEKTCSTFSRSLCMLWRLESLYVFGAYEEALVVAATLERQAIALQGIPYVSELHFYQALTLAARSEPSTFAHEDGGAALRAKEQLYRGWAASCPQNFAAQHALIQAEILRLSGREIDALRGYEEAIAAARESGLLHIEAIANEVAARCYRALGLPSSAKSFLLQARAAYERWGAAGKVRQLERRHPELRERLRPASTRIAAPPEQLDLMSVFKAAQTISGELDLDHLIGRLIQVVLEQSGAEIGRLLLVRDTELRIESEAVATEHGIETRRVSSSGGGVVPDSVINYVLRTREPVFLADASATGGAGRFASDAYFARVHPKSVLCLPLVRGAAIVAILYLENNLAGHAFTPERIAALDVIASQAAITLEVAFWIRQEREAREALTRSERRFRRLSDSNMIGIFFSDGERITEANDCFLDMVGYTREDLVADRIRWTELTPPEHVAKDEAALRELEVSGICRPYEKEYIRKDGSRVPILLGCALLEGTTRESTAYVLDITERRLAERERDQLLVQEQDARSTAENALLARDEFLSVAAHELRTPLSPLKMQLEVLTLLARKTIPPGSRGCRDLLEMLEKSTRQVDQLSALMTELLDISHIGTGPLVLSERTTDLYELVCDVIGARRTELEHAGCVVEFDGQRHLVGRWDCVRLAQVVTNLLTNAIKYGAGKPIAIGLIAEGDSAKLTIRDHGIGIDEKDQSRIFDRFERAVSLRHFGGFGLGLYISQKIVRAYGGNITVESRPGAGSTFTVRLPLEPRAASGVAPA